MAYCPQCGTEYAQGSPECIDCHVNLMPGPPPNVDGQNAEDAISHDVKLVTVHVFGGLTAHASAELAKNWLEAEGIPCVLVGANASRIYHAFDVPLMVREEDAEEAAQILKDYLESSQPAGEESI